MSIDLRNHLERALGSAVRSLDPVAGGDVAEAFRATLADGRTLFAKTRANAAADFFETEAASLAWLREASAARIPRVLDVSREPPALLLEWIEVGRSVADTEEKLGRALAALHATGAPCFGREDRRTTGSRGLPNDPCDRWSEFYATRRLLPLARLASEQDALPLRAIRDLERVSARLESLGGPEEPPARLHGDLWAGNRLVDASGESWLIDPAAHGGHREFDLAMMRLFGGFGDACFAAYDEVFPLAPGWEERVALHQLAPLAVHAIKFGGSYRDATQRALDALR